MSLSMSPKEQTYSPVMVTQLPVCRERFVHVAGGMVHGFGFGVDGGEMIEGTGNDRQAISMFHAQDSQVPSGPPDVTKIVDVAGQYDVAFHL
jgi:hypothetical protein